LLARIYPKQSRIDTPGAECHRWKLLECLEPARLGRPEFPYPNRVGPRGRSPSRVHECIPASSPFLSLYQANGFSKRSSPSRTSCPAGISTKPRAAETARRSRASEIRRFVCCWIGLHRIHRLGQREKLVCFGFRRVAKQEVFSFPQRCLASSAPCERSFY
jgi:hypothetical protein